MNHAGAPIRLGFDATPLLGQHTGIGTYAKHLLENLLLLDDAPTIRATAFSLRGYRELGRVVPAGVATLARPAPVGLLHRLWSRSELVPAEWLSGRSDVFHATNFVLPPLRRARGVLSVHDLSFLRYPATVSTASLRYRKLVPASIARAEVICTLTAAMGAEIAAEYGADPAAIVVAAPGADPSWFEAKPLDAAGRRRLGLPEQYIVAVGTLEPRKNLAKLIAAHAQLGAVDPSTPPLVLAGPAGWGPELAAPNRHDGSLILTGYLPTADLQAVVAGAQCLAFPSLYEGFGMPTVEALACGVPVMATDMAVTREVLGQAAVLVDSLSIDSLSAGLISALALPRGGADESRRIQARRWSWPDCAKSALTAYRMALS